MSVLNKLLTGISFPRKSQQTTDKAPVAPPEPSQEHDPCLDQPLLSFVEELKQVHSDKQLNKYSLAMLTYMKKSKIKTRGAKAALPAPSFAALRALPGFSAEIVESLGRQFGFARPTATQAIAIPNILRGRNFVGIAPTGSGKTLAYLAPLCQLLRDKPAGQALIVAPTFELSVQIYKVCLQLIGKSSPLFGLRVTHIQKMEEPIERYQVVVTTPQKFLGLVAAASSDALVRRFEVVVLDEADKFFELSFMPQLEQLLELFKTHEKQYVLVSATLPTEVEKLIGAVFVDKVQAVVGGKVNVLNTIEQRLVYCATEEGKLYELENIINGGALEVPCVVFVQSKERVRQVFRVLRKMKVYADYLSSELSLQAREARLRQFEEGRTWVLVTTDLLARGVDFPDLKLVINFDIPPNNVAYVHRVGRTGRAGRRGRALTFYTNEDKLLVRRLADLLRESGCDVPEWIFTIEKGDKRQLKRLETKPQWREAVGRPGQGASDRQFNAEMRRKDGVFYKKKGAQGPEEGGDEVEPGLLIEGGQLVDEDQLQDGESQE